MLLRGLLLILMYAIPGAGLKADCNLVGFSVYRCDRRVSRVRRTRKTPKHNGLEMSPKGRLWVAHIQVEKILV